MEPRKRDWSDVRNCQSPRKAISGYSQAFEVNQRLNELFLFYFAINDDKTISRIPISRSQFLVLLQCAKQVLFQSNIQQNDTCMHCFTSNTIEDVVFRIAAVGVGSVPVTMNWDNDTVERVLFKRQTSNAKLILYDDERFIVSIRSDIVSSGVLALNAKGAIAEQLISLFGFMSDHVDTDLQHLPSAQACTDYIHHLASQVDSPTSGIDLIFPNAMSSLSDTKIIIFTSGTTNNPKGVRLSYMNYEFSRACFDHLMGFSVPSSVDLLIANGMDNSDGSSIRIAVVNPLHHTNSSAMIDWACRKPNSRIYLFQKYTTQYWYCLFEIVCDHVDYSNSDNWEQCVSDDLNQKKCKIIAPLVSRHIDFLADLYGSTSQANRSLPISASDLKSTFQFITMLLGSAPVGPTTIRNLMQIIGQQPVIRYGSTETCLQVIGTRDSSNFLSNIEFGCTARGEGKAVGYYIGQDHFPFNEVRIVKSVDADSLDYLVDCPPNEDGLIITAGGNVMSGYLLESDTFRAISSDGWFLRLGDIGFWMPSSDFSKNFFWVGRTSNMLIKGGSNYSYDQITGDIADMLANLLDLTCSVETGDYDMAVVGVKLTSEHEDDCCLVMDLITDKAVQLSGRIEEAVMGQVNGKKLLKKGSKPDNFRFRKVPRNFKGLVELKVLKDFWSGELKHE